MKLAVALLLFFISVMPGHALLGDSLKDLKRKYGQPIDAGTSREAGTDRYEFRWYSYLVTVMVHDGSSVSEEFTRADRKEFSLGEVQKLLMESSEPGLTWTQVNGSTWKQQDRVATWSARLLTVEEKARAWGRRK